MINEIKQDAEHRMGKTMDALNTAFNKIRTGRPNPALLNAVVVDYYGNPTPLSQVASLGVEDGRTLTVQPWEAKLVPAIEKAILKSDLGLNPTTSGNLIRVPMPALTEETRKNYIKQARAEAETARVSVRNIRRDANAQLKDLLKEKEISEDDDRRAQEHIQKITDKHIQDIDKLLHSKEEDLMQI